MDIKSALIVDDSKMAQLVLKKQLESMDVAVQAVGSGEDAIEFLTQNNNHDQPDIIFMDCLMPGMDGFEATKLIIENPNTSNIPVVMCTGKESDDDKKKAFALGASGYMSKSSSAEPLQAILEEFSRQSTGITPPVETIDLSEISKISAITSRDIATEVSTEIATRIASTTAKDISRAQISAFSDEFTQNSNKQIVQLSEQLEEKVIFSVKSSLQDTHNYIDEKFSHIDNSLLPALKVEMNELVSLAIDDLKAELDKADISAEISVIVGEKIHKAIENNLSTYVSVLLEHEVAQILIESKIQKELEAHNSKIQSLEDRISLKPDSNSNGLSIFAILLAAGALAYSLYPLLMSA